MANIDYEKRRRAKRRQMMFRRIEPIILVLVLVVCGVGIYRHVRGSEEKEASVIQNEVAEAASGDVEVNIDPEDIQVLTPLESLLARADRLAAGYDYDAAIDLLMDDAEFSSSPEVAAAIASYEEIKSGLVQANITMITHVFFHSLIVDTSKAFDGDQDQQGYNQVMTTVDEFKKIIQTMYDRGYVLVRLHDMATVTKNEAGEDIMVAGKIMLPEGKTPFVMSQDDLCYYQYMADDGFACRMVIGDDGYPTCEMELDDGSIVTGPYDLVPILEDFIQEHPDFSYKGARAVLAFTGYQGILGYRTAFSYEETNPNFAEDRETAALVAECLKEHGWELASHSWGHLDLGTISWDRFQADCDKWQAEVNTLIGPTDIILFPFGADISTWQPYNHENERYNYLFDEGFRYFCNVDASTPYWVQLGRDCIRQGRRNLDGYRLWQDISAESEGRPRRLEDLFHAEDIFDPARPTPVVYDENL